MLELRPSCECCDRDLPPDRAGAMICSFECTFCERCASDTLHGTCRRPLHGARRILRHGPPRPAAALAKYPASTQRIHKPQGCNQTST